MKYQPAHTNELRINRLRLHVHLGWTDEERAQPQPVDVDLFIRFPEPPPACKTDDLSGTVCYAGICEKLDESIRSKPFKLIERLSAHLYEVAKAQLSPQTAVQVHLTKINVPVKNLLGGTSFSFGDFGGDFL